MLNMFGQAGWCWVKVFLFQNNADLNTITVWHLLKVPTHKDLTHTESAAKDVAHWHQANAHAAQHKAVDSLFSPTCIKKTFDFFFAVQTFLKKYVENMNTYSIDLISYSCASCWWWNRTRGRCADTEEEHTHATTHEHKRRHRTFYRNNTQASHTEN